MSWFSGANPLDELVERATDSSLLAGSEDLALNLEICDQIRSKAVPAKDAMRSLKKRISNKNPNVQLLALNLSDLCIKNGGSHFLVEIASREFVDNLLSLLRAPSGINHDVRSRLLELIQTWALAFESRSDLSYMMSTYQSLRTEGIQFPLEERIASAFVDTAAPPDWADSDVCMRCRTAFTFRNRKHHCRNCGNAFCGQCSSQTMTLPQLGINEPVRVCDGCHAKRAQSSRSDRSAPSPRGTATPAYQPPKSSYPGKSTSSPIEEDLDLKRALELSLAESAPVQVTKTAPPQRSAVEGEDDDDDMRAAIAASLKESTAKVSKATYTYPSLDTGMTSYESVESSTDQTQDAKASFAKQHTKPPLRSTHELQPTEQDNIRLFATLVDKLKVASQGSILRDSQIQELYESVTALRPKLARALGDTVGKYETLVETHSKLATCVKYYDRILEARLASTYGRGQYATEVPSYAQHNDPYFGSSHSAYYAEPQHYDSGYEQSHQAHKSHESYSGYYGNPPTSREYPPASQAPADFATGSTYGQNLTSEAQQSNATPKEEVSLIDL